MAAQRGKPIEGGVIQAFSDLRQLHPEGAIIKNVLQAIHLSIAVVAVAAFSHPAGLQQADLVIPAQGAGGHPGQLRQLLNGIFHENPSL